MVWILRDEEIRSILSLEGTTRYSYTVKKVVDQERIWSLRHEGAWALAGNEAGNEIIPIWPHEQFAHLCSNGLWAGYEPGSIDLEAWLERWTPGMARDNRCIAVFPTSNDKGVVVEPELFRAALLEELSDYD